MIEKIRKNCALTCFISGLNGGEVARDFQKKEFKNLNTRKFRIEKVINEKDDTLYVKQRGYNNSLNRWIDKKDIV